MDWMYYSPDSANYPSLGCYVGNKYTVADNARTTLEQMNRRLLEEDRTLRTFRRSLGFTQVLTKDLGPILIETKDQREVFLATIKLLINLLTPIECLCSSEDLNRTEEGQQTLFELQQQLRDAKAVFLDQRITRNILELVDKELVKIGDLRAKCDKLAAERKGMAADQAKSEEAAKADVKDVYMESAAAQIRNRTRALAEKHRSRQKERNRLEAQKFLIGEEDDEEMSEEEEDARANLEVSVKGVNDCLTLLRNILHIPDEGKSGGSSPSSSSTNSKSASRQNQILWNLFSANLGAVIVKIIGSPHIKSWCTTLMQLIALIYKDQHVYNLQRLLGNWLETELSESSEDNESNTSPQYPAGSCSSPSGETDDSSDGKNSRGNRNGENNESSKAKGRREAANNEDTEYDDGPYDSSNTDSGNETNKFEAGESSSSNTASRPKALAKGKMSGPSNDMDTNEDKGREGSNSDQNSDASSGKEPPCKQGKSRKAAGKPDSKLATAAPSHHRKHKHTHAAATLHTALAAVAEANGASGINKRKATSPLTSGSENENDAETTSCLMGQSYSRESAETRGKRDASTSMQSSNKKSKSKSRAKNSSGIDSGINSNPSPASAATPTDMGASPVGGSGRAAGGGTQNNSGSEGISDYSIMVGVNVGVAEVGGVNAPENASCSTSSNDDDNERKRKVKPHTNLQKPRPQKPNISPAEKRELRRKKLIQRAKSDWMKVKALVHHVPTEDDIADLLKEFTVDFLLKGYSTLVDELRKQLLEDAHLQMDKSHFLWLITYFLKFAAQLEVEMDLIGPVLSIPTISYLTYEGVRFYEELELASREKTVDLKPHLRRMHLVVTAIHEFITTLETYSGFSHFSPKDKETCHKIQRACGTGKELRQLFLLLIRRYNPNVQSLQYLHDLIGANHSVLVMMENSWNELGETSDPDFMTKHLKQFASVEVMRQYGLLLESFSTNSESTNDAIFTLMHHISGDLNSPEALYVPQILKSFSDIWEQVKSRTMSSEGGYGGMMASPAICDDWADLIEFVIQKFITSMGTKPHTCASNLLDSLDPNSDAMDETGFTKNQLDNLYWYFQQCESTEDPVGGIIDLYKVTYSVTKTRLSIIQALLSQGIITHAQYMGLMYMKSVLSCKPDHESSVVAEAGSEHCDSDGHDTDHENTDDNNPKVQLRDQVEVLKELLRKQGKAHLLHWLQQILLDTCLVKLNQGALETDDDLVTEPVPYHYNYVNQSIPMVPWNKQQESGLHTETFILLLHTLGFHLAADVGKVFPRIPHFWSADHILALAQKLGKIRNPVPQIRQLMATTSAVSDTMERDDRPLPREILASPTQSLPPSSSAGGDQPGFGYNESEQSQPNSAGPTAAPWMMMDTSPSPSSSGPGRFAIPLSMPPGSEGVPDDRDGAPPLTLFPVTSPGGFMSMPGCQGNSMPMTTSVSQTEAFAMPTPTSSWLQMAVLSKTLISSTSSTKRGGNSSATPGTSESSSGKQQSGGSGGSQYGGSVTQMSTTVIEKTTTILKQVTVNTTHAPTGSCSYSQTPTATLTGSARSNSPISPGPSCSSSTPFFLDNDDQSEPASDEPMLRDDCSEDMERMQITDGDHGDMSMRMPSIVSEDEDLGVDPERADLETQVSDDGVEQLTSDEDRDANAGQTSDSEDDQNS